MRGPNACGRSASAVLSLHPRTIDRTPRMPILNRVAENKREAIFAHAIIALQHGKPRECGGNAYGSESRMRGCGEGAAVVHCRAHSHASRHLVVQQAANFFSQFWLNPAIELVIRSRLRGVDRAGKIAFKQLEYRLELFN